MNDEERLMWLFEQVHGKITGSCYTEVNTDDDVKAVSISVMKDGNLCWIATREELVFDYLTKGVTKIVA